MPALILASILFLSNFEEPHIHRLLLRPGCHHPVFALFVLKAIDLPLSFKEFWQKLPSLLDDRLEFLRRNLEEFLSRTLAESPRAQSLVKILFPFIFVISLDVVAFSQRVR